MLSFVVASGYAVWKNPDINWIEWWTIGVASLMVIFFIIVVMVPMQFKFGGENSRMVMIGVFLGTFAGCYLIITVLKQFGVDMDALVNNIASLGAPLLILILAAIIIGGLFISMKISERIINNKEY